MNTEHASSPQEIARIIREVVARTESIFDGIAAIFPELSREADRSVRASGERIGALEAETVSIRESGSSSLIGKTRKIIGEASDAFHDLHSRDDILLGTLREDIEAVRSLDSGIADIRESSESMELISLNAMTVAIKAGKSGGAFSYITEELKRISARSIGYTEELTAEGAEINKVFNTFLASMERVEQLQDELFRDFGSFINEGIGKAAEATGKAVDFLKEITAETGEVRGPLVTIMQQVQHQDIIRQALDHVVLALGELKPDNETYGDPEEELDELSFLKTLPALCSGLIEDVAGRIRESHGVFRASIEEIAGLIGKVEKDISGRSRGYRVAKVFEQAEDSIAEIMKNVNRSLEMKNEIISKSQTLMDRVNDLQDSFTDFAELVGQFQNVNVASRIEVAKQEALAAMEGTVDEMAGMTGFIETTVDNALKSIRSFVRRTGDSLDQYREIYRSESAFALSFYHQMNAIAEETRQGLQEIERVIGGFSAFSDGFIQAYRRSEELLRELDGCAGELHSGALLLDGIEQHYSERFDRLLSGTGRTEWSIRSERLQRIIERFTILDHKKAAGRIGGFEVEEGGEGGDVTFF